MDSRLLIIVSVALAAGCGGTSPSGTSGADASSDADANGAEDGGEGGTGGSATLSGALTKTIPCTVTQAFFGYALPGQSRLSIECMDGTTTLSLGLTAQGELSNGATFTPPMSVSFVAQIFDGANSWGSHSGVDTTLGGGTGSISLSSVTVTASTASSKDYQLHGTSTISLPGFATTPNSSVISAAITF